MNDIDTGYLVLSPQFARQFVQCLEHLNNIDQHTNASNLALPFALLPFIDDESPSDSTNQSPGL